MWSDRNPVSKCAMVISASLLPNPQACGTNSLKLLPKFQAGPGRSPLTLSSCGSKAQIWLRREVHLFCIVEPSLREIWFDRFDIPDSGGREGLALELTGDVPRPMDDLRRSFRW